MERIKINALSIENVKRVRAVALTPSRDGLTIIGGRNGQGKTSVLDAIAWTLGGEKFRPGTPQRDGAMLPPTLHVELSNGIVVERRGKNAELRVTDPTGKRAGQMLLDAFISKLALDLPRFMNATAKQKADTLLQIIGVKDEVMRLEDEEKRLYDSRRAVGQLADQKQKHVDDLPYYDGLPKEPISAMELIRRQQDILARNGENARKRTRRDAIAAELSRVNEQLEALAARKAALESDYATACRDALDLLDEGTEELEADIAQIDETNRKIRQNNIRDSAQAEASHLAAQYDELTEQLEAVRRERHALLEGAALPLEGLTVENGELLYLGKPWDCMSASQQLRVAAAIAASVNPECGFVLMDKLEQLDPETLEDFGAWLCERGLQVIATRVSTGDECTIIIEDGAAQAQEAVVTPAQPARQWKKGEF